MLSGKELWHGIQFSRIAVSSAILKSFNQDAGRKYLISSLGKLPGVPAKAAQMLQMKFGLDSRPAQPKPMSLGLVRQLIEERSPKLARDIVTIDEKACVASLGQVHRAKLATGAEIAVKLQYPGVDEQVESQLSLLLKAFQAQGPAKDYGMDVVAYRKYLEAHFRQETDYRLEAIAQLEFQKAWTASFVVVPKVHVEYSSEKILVQSFEASQSLEEISALDRQSREDCALLMTSFLFTSLFGTQLLHLDLHPNNFGFRVKEKNIVLYDFGATMSLDPHYAKLLLLLIRLAERPAEFAQRPNVFDAFVSLGFDPEKLVNIALELPKLNEAIFEPLSRNSFWEAKGWDLGSKLDDVLGSKKWWFRISGPPWFLMMMRGVQGVINALTILDVPLPLKNIFEMILKNYDTPTPPIYVEDYSSRFDKEIFEVASKAPREAKNLRVRVSEGKEDIVLLEMPVAAVDSLEDLVAPEIREKIEESGYDLVAIREDVQKIGYKAQLLFETDVGHRHYKVWLD